MVLHIFDVYQDIVQIDDYSVVQEFPHDFVHHCRKGRGGFDKPERHDLVFVLSVSCTKV